MSLTQLEKNNAISPDIVLSQLRWRYATKEFDTTAKIPSEIWRALEEALVLSPSSYGLQPWKFFVVDNPEYRQQLFPASWNQGQITQASHLVVFAIKSPFSVEDIDRYINRIVEVRGGDPSSLDFYRNIMLAHLDKTKRPEDFEHWAEKQVYIALGNFLTTAANLGVDACPMEGIDRAKYDDILALKDRGYKTVVVATAGTRSPNDKYATAPKVRYNLDEVISHL